MFYSPKQNKKALLTAALMLALSVVVLALRSVFSSAGLYISIGVMIFLTAAIFITVRFVITKYVYEITSDSLVITKIVGQRKQTAAALLLETGMGIAPRPKGADKKREFSEKFGRTDSRMSYTQNIFSNGYIYVTEFNGRIFEIILECSEEFASALSAAVDEARKRNEEEE